MYKPSNQGKASLKRAQHKRADGQKIEHCRQRDGRKQKQTQLTAPGTQREHQQSRAQQKPEQHVRQPCQPRAQTAQRAQHIICRAQPQTKPHAPREQKRLCRDWKLHQPNSLAKKPPRGTSSS